MSTVTSSLPAQISDAAHEITGAADDFDPVMDLIGAQAEIRIRNCPGAGIGSASCAKRDAVPASQESSSA